MSKPYHSNQDFSKTPEKIKIQKVSHCQTSVFEQKSLTVLLCDYKLFVFCIMVSVLPDRRRAGGLCDDWICGEMILSVVLTVMIVLVRRFCCSHVLL